MALPTSPYGYDDAITPFTANDVPSLPFNGANSLSNQNYTGDGHFTGNDDVLDLEDIFNGDNSLSNHNYNGDNSLSIEDYTCDDVPYLDFTGNDVDRALPFNGDNSLSIEDNTCNDVHFTGNDVDRALPFNGDNSLSIEDYTCNDLDFTRNDVDNGGENAGEPIDPFSIQEEDYTGGKNNSIMSEDWRMIVPVGMKFRPTDEELVINYLQPESFGVTSCSDGIITRLDVYHYQPNHLSSKAVDFGDGKMYFYTHIKKIGKSKNDRKIKSRPGCHWKATQAPKEIKDNTTGATIGYKTSLAYHEEEDKKTQWLMKEYRLKSHSSSPEDGELVLAVIYYHHRKRKREDEDN